MLMNQQKKVIEIYMSHILYGILDNRYKNNMSEPTDFVEEF